MKKYAGMRDFFLSLDPAIVLERKQTPTPYEGLNPLGFGAGLLPFKVGYAIGFFGS